MSSVTLHQCWIIIGIIALMLLWGVWRHPEPAVHGHCSPAAAVPDAGRYPFVVEVVGRVARPGVYSFPREVGIAEVIGEAGITGETVSVLPGYSPGVLINGSRLSVGRDGACSEITLMDAHKRFLFFVPFAVNAAGAEELMLVPGIAEKTARAIVSYRERHGHFLRLEDLLKVPGIGPRNFAQMRNFLVL